MLGAKEEVVNDDYSEKRERDYYIAIILYSLRRKGEKKRWNK